MKKFFLLGCFLMALMLLMPLGLVWASYDYYIPIEVYNNGSESWSGSVLVSINNSQLVDLGYVDSSGLDTDVQAGAVSQDYMVASYNLGIYLPELEGYQTRTYNYRLGQDPKQDSFSVVLGEGGNITIPDDAGLELGDVFEIEFYVWTRTESGSDKDFVYKQEAFRTYIQAEGTIRAAILDAGGAENISATISGISSQEVKVLVEANGTNMTLSIWNSSGTSLGTNTTDLSGASVPDNSNNWIIMRNNSVGYIDYFKIRV